MRCRTEVERIIHLPKAEHEVALRVLTCVSSNPGPTAPRRYREKRYREKQEHCVVKCPVIRAREKCAIWLPCPSRRSESSDAPADPAPAPAVRAREKVPAVARFLPSLTDLAFLMPLIFIFFRLNGARTLLGDGDTGWHIRTGEWILAHHRVPQVDMFSFSRPGAPWFAWEWLWDVLFALHFISAGGWPRWFWPALSSSA